MRGARGRGRTQSARRKFDTSDFALQDVFSDSGPVIDLIGGWAINPADSWDPVLEYQQPNNSTLIATRMSLQGTVRLDGAGACLVAHSCGLIVWPTTTDVQVPVELPDPTLPYPWVWRHHQQCLVGVTSSGLEPLYTFDNQFGPESIVGSKAQRKLPEGHGLLYVQRIAFTTFTEVTVWTNLHGSCWMKLA